MKDPVIEQVTFVLDTRTRAMEFSQFRRFIVSAPDTLKGLLGEVGIQDTAELRHRLIAFFNGITDDDIQVFRREGTIPIERRLQLCGELGIEGSIGGLAIRIYELYTSNRDKLTNPSSFTEEEVRFFITDGHCPLEYHGIVQGGILRWNPDTQMVLCVMEDDDNIYNACKNYLKSQGRDFTTIDEFVRFAELHQWPGWEVIRRRYDDPFGTLEMAE